MHNTNVFGIGMFEDEICFKQINVVSHTFLILIYKTLSIDLFSLFVIFKLSHLKIMRVYASLTKIIMFSHI
jgi:hypothetical protein